MSSRDDSATEFEEFVATSTRVLDTAHAGLLDALASVDPQPGVWHPTGFAIWRLRTLPNGITLRLHVWPSHGRHVRDWGPQIHAHGWHLASRVLTGTYRDRLFRVSDTTTLASGVRPMNGYEVSHLDGGISEIIPNCEEVYVEAAESRVVLAGEAHFIHHGIFHETSIPATDLVATLIAMGPMVTDRSIALEDSAHDIRQHQRMVVGEQEQKSILSDLLRHIRQ